VVEIRGSSHLVIRGIEFTGGSHGIRLMDSDYVTIEDCEIYETGDVAISANSGGTYEGLRIIRNHIHHTNGTGEGMYLGCNNDACRVANSLIEGNYVHHTNRSTVEQGDGIEIKGGSYGNIVRDDVIHDTKYPGILVYGTAGNGSANIIERNVIWNVGDNTVISAGNAVDVRDVTGPVLIANNAIYAQGTALSLISGDLAQVQLAGNVGEGRLSGASSGYSNGNGIVSDMVDGNYSGSPPIDPFPVPGSALIGAGDENHIVTDDFNGAPRDGAADVGAYTFREAGNPGWAISEAFKSIASSLRPSPPENVQAE
jgi:hypothetical protein